LIAGQSALITLVRLEEQPTVEQELERLGGHIVAHEVAGDLIDKLSIPIEPEA
jgi:hypothetical protein